MQIIVYIRTEPGKALEILEKIRSLAGVKFVAATTGRFDVVARIEVPDVQSIGKSVVEEIQRIPGVRYTETSVIVAT
jgi:DNA-binding Lrp family transcriptional regulator